MMAATTHKATASAPPTPAGEAWDVRRPRPIKPVLDGDTEVFCNREVNMQQIRAVGFDMDYTLAQYNLAFELLAYDGAKKKLVEDLGYPVRACFPHASLGVESDVDVETSFVALAGAVGPTDTAR
jgi:hypothetical protein